jgi:hypothetical protein
MGRAYAPQSKRKTGAGEVCGNDGMCDLMLRQGPEGRRLNVSPARKGWGIDG